MKIIYIYTILLKGVNFVNDIQTYRHIEYNLTIVMVFNFTSEIHFLRTIKAAVNGKDITDDGVQFIIKHILY